MELTKDDTIEAHLEAIRMRYRSSLYEVCRCLLGYKDVTDLSTGLTDMWEWAKKQPKRNQFVWPRYELEKGLYQFWK